MDEHLSTLVLHRLRYGELEGEAATRVRAHLDSCEACRRRLQVQQANREAFVLQAVPPAIARLDRATPRPWWVRWGWIAPVAVAAAALVVVVPRVVAPTAGSAVEQITRKGGDVEQLEVWILDADGTSRAAEPDEALAAGTPLQIVYAARGAAWVGFAGRDASGEVEVYGVIEPGDADRQAAPFALQLDGSGDQELFAVPADHALSADEVRRAVVDDAPGVRRVRVRGR